MLSYICVNSYLRNSAPSFQYLLSPPLYNVSDHANYMFTVRMWSLQHVSAIFCYCDPGHMSVPTYPLYSLLSFVIHYWVLLFITEFCYSLLSFCYPVNVLFLGWHPPAINSYIRTTSLAWIDYVSQLNILHFFFSSLNLVLLFSNLVNGWCMCGNHTHTHKCSLIWICADDIHWSNSVAELDHMWDRFLSNYNYDSVQNIVIRLYEINCFLSSNVNSNLCNQCTQKKFSVTDCINNQVDHIYKRGIWNILYVESKQINQRW